MKVNTLYRVDKVIGDNYRKHPKNHLSTEDSFTPFCGAKNVEWMGGVIEYNNGKFITDGIVLTLSEMETMYCKKCLNKLISPPPKSK